LKAKNMRLKLVMENPPTRAKNYELTQFPPPDDFPVCIDPEGTVLARFGDDRWPMTYWCGRICAFNFGQLSTTKAKSWSSEQESLRFRCIMAFMMWCSPESIKPSTLFTRYGALKKVFLVCRDLGVSVADIHKFPELVDKLIVACSTKVHHLVKALRLIYDHRDTLGFMILDLKQIADLHVALSNIKSNQTPYIPSRISNLHLERSIELMDDYLAHSRKFERLFEEAWEGYLFNNDAPTAWGDLIRLNSPYSKRSATLSYLIYHGTFASSARKHGVEDILKKWMCGPGKTFESLKIGVLSRFFGAIALVGATCIASLSAMRKEEINNLRSDCFITENTDDGPAYFLQGRSTKTIQDSEALWVTCQDTEKVVKAMASVSRVRMKCAVARGIKHDPSELKNPYLIMRAYEPWGGHYSEDGSDATGIRRAMAAATIEQQCPNFFPLGSTIITEEDFDEAVKINPGLDVERFAVGEPWSFAFHQFRRTLMVNSHMSGLVSPQSMQYQLKHLYQSMSMYYGRNGSHLAVSQKVAEEYVSNFYESMARNAVELKSPDFVSLISPLHKERVTSFMEMKNLKQLVGMAKKGLFSIKETIMGICLNSEHCEFGSADYVLGCDQCVSGLACKQNLPIIQKTNDWIEMQLEDDKVDGPRRESLSAQHRFTQRLINVVLQD